MSKTNPARGVVWNLSGIYSGINDPQIAKDKKEVEKLTLAFTKKYKGKVGKLAAVQLRGAIKEHEKLLEKLYIYLNFASYLHSLDTRSPKIGAFYQTANEFATQISSKLLWFSLEIQSIPEKFAKKLLNSQGLSEYKHYLAHLRVFSKYRKSLAEEEIMTKLSMSGSDAFVRFYDEKSASDIFEYKGKKLNYAEIASIMKDDPKEENRKAASEAYTKNYKDNQRFYAYVLNTLLLDKKLTDEIRGYKYPQQATFLSYEVEPEIVESLTNTVEKNYSLSERYYKAKSKILGRKLSEWDRYSQLFYKDAEKQISWDEARKIVLASFSKFDKGFADIADMFFKKGWIDAEVSNTKRGGAFCSLGVPSKNPYILMSFTGKIDDVMTLAHELGHGIHAYLSRSGTLHNFYPSTATAEIASVFAESLVFDHLYSELSDDTEKLNLLANKIQGGFATIFRQIAFYKYEEKIHMHRREKGELSVDDFSIYFQNSLKKMFGKGLTLTDQHRYWWMPILHFYHYNFYVFTYAFGEALTLSLYQKYKTGAVGFGEKYKNALSMGGSLSPKEITTLMGIDISKPGFWQNGIDLLEEYVDEFEDLAKKLS